MRVCRVTCVCGCGVCLLFELSMYFCQAELFSVLASGVSKSGKPPPPPGLEFGSIHSATHPTTKCVSYVKSEQLLVRLCLPQVSAVFVFALAVASFLCSLLFLFLL